MNLFDYLVPFALAAVVSVQVAQVPRMPPRELPAAAVQRLADGLAGSRAQRTMPRS